MTTIRRAQPQDAAAISALILGEAHHVTLAPDGAGAELVLASMRADAIEQNMTEGKFCYWVYEDADAPSLRGALGLREGKHLYQLFVRTDCHRLGIGRALWDRMLDDWPSQWDKPEYLTVNASPYGLKAYQSFGFEPVGERTEINGIAYIPMRCHLSTEFIQRS